MTSTISTTIPTAQETLYEAIGGPEAIPSGYRHLAEQASAALTERDYDLFDSLLRTGQRLGASYGQVVNELQALGLRERPAPEPESVESGSMAGTEYVSVSTFRDFADRVNRFLSRHGFGSLDS